MLKCFNLETKPNDVINLTDDIKQFVAESGIQSGECDYVLLGSGWL